MRTKFLMLFVCTILCTAFFLLGCDDSKNDAIVGEWTPTTATIGGQTIKYDELDNEKSKFSLSFEANGKCRATLAGIESSGTYVFNNTSVDVTLDGKERKLSYEGGNLTLIFDYDAVNTSITFTKVQN